VRDDDVRSACFATLDVLQAKWGADVPYEALREGFNFRGRRVPFMSRGFGIYRSRDAQRGPAALSVNSSFKQDRYRDEQTPDGVLYRYQGDDPENYFNRWLRSAHLLDVPIVYFVGTRPNHYRPIYPTYVAEDDPGHLRVLLTFGESTRRNSEAPCFLRTATGAPFAGFEITPARRGAHRRGRRRAG